MPKLIVGNWKMHGTGELARELAQGATRISGNAAIVLCPPFTLLASVRPLLSQSEVALGGQDCHDQAQGAFTGDISAGMLKEAGCRYVIAGHSERRTMRGESSAQVKAKATQAIEAGLIPIICVGESLIERDSGQAEAVVSGQVTDSLPENATLSKGYANFVLAYEPVWAIGSGRTPSNGDIGSMHAAILAAAAARSGLDAKAIPVLYGGSVKADNAHDILAIAGVGGVLVGGASLKAEDFRRIAEAAGN